MKPTDAAYIEIPEAELLARDPGGQYTEIRKALDIADQLMLRALDVTDREGREPYLLPAAAITTLAQMVAVLSAELDRLRHCGDSRVAEIERRLALADQQIRKLKFPESYPECSGNPASCPENEGRGCCNGVKS